MNRKTVYEAYTRRVVFEGTADECWAWLMKLALNENCGMYRMWTDVDGDRHIDVGNVYIFNDWAKKQLHKPKKQFIIII